MQQIHWSDIEVRGKSTDTYICSQHLDSLLRNDEKDEALKHKFIAQKCTEEFAKKNGNCSTWLDVTGEDVYIENMTPELEILFSENKFIVIEKFDAHTNCDGEDPPSIVIIDKTIFYPVNFVDYQKDISQPITVDEN